MITFFIPGEPVAKARPRITGKGFAYTPAKTMRAEENIRLHAYQAMAGRDLLDEPIEVSIVAVFLPPASRTLKAAKLPTAAFKPTKPDIDNLAKSVMDACNQVVWQDDSRISVINVAKVYGTTPGIHVTVKLVDPRRWPFCVDARGELARVA